VSERRCRPLLLLLGEDPPDDHFELLTPSEGPLLLCEEPPDNRSDLLLL